MRIRMYLRGLGIGIVVTALIMGITASRKPAMTDEEIKAKAAAMGMVEQDSVLKPVIIEETPEEDPVTETSEEAPATEATKEAPEEAPATEATEEAPEEASVTEPPAEEATKEDAKEAGPGEEEEKAEESAAEDAPKEAAESTPSATDDSNVKTSGTFTLEIAGGYGSEQVCALLEKGGMIRSASDFDKYLCDHGYDHKIRTGKYTISAGADYETIAKTITGL